MIIKRDNRETIWLIKESSSSTTGFIIWKKRSKASSAQKDFRANLVNWQKWIHSMSCKDLWKLWNKAQNKTKTNSKTIMKDWTKFKKTWRKKATIEIKNSSHSFTRLILKFRLLKNGKRREEWKITNLNHLRKRRIVKLIWVSVKVLRISCRNKKVSLKLLLNKRRWVQRMETQLTVTVD